MSDPKIMKWNTQHSLLNYVLLINRTPPYSTWGLMSFSLNTEVVLKVV
jgi:hypothetical protein